MQCGSWVEFSVGFGLLLLGGVHPPRSGGWEVSALSSFAAAPGARVQWGHHHREPHLQDRKGGRAVRLGPDAQLCLCSEGGGRPGDLQLQGQPPGAPEKATQGAHGLHRPPAGTAGAQLRATEVPERARPHGARSLAQPHRHAGQDLVPEPQVRPPPLSSLPLHGPAGTRV